MAFLIVAGVTVKVNELPKQVRENVDDAPAFNNTQRASVVGTRKYNYSVTTAPMTRATADTLIAAIPAATSLACSGDGIVTGNYLARFDGETPVMVTPSNHRFTVSFTLKQV